MAGDVKTVRLVNSESGSVINVDEETAAQLGPEWSTDTKKDRPSAQSNTFGVAPKVDLTADAAAEDATTTAKKSSSSKSSK